MLIIQNNLALRKIFLLIYGFFYISMFHYIYVNYLNKVFEYAYYMYIERDFIEYFYCYFFALFPLIFYRSNQSISGFGVSLIYLLCYSPGQLMLLFMWKFSFYELIVVQILLLISMIMFFLSASLTTVKNGFLLPSKKFIYAIHLISILGIFLVIWAYSSTMSLVGFDQVYELRSEANSLSKGFLVDYFLVWITFLSIPFYTSMSIIKKDFKYALIAVFISILIYSAQGAKIAALSILIILAIFILTKIKGDILKKLLVSSSIIFMVLASLPDDGIYMWIKSILMVRIYSNAGWALVTYYEYFTTHIHTYYTHIGPINMIFNSYPYGNYSLGQLIGIQYFGSEKVNYNANFWASDGLAAIGNYGLIIISFIISVYFFILNRITSKFSHIFLYMFCSGFLMAMQNLPFTTSLLSGGGLFILFMFIFLKFTKGR